MTCQTKLHIRWMIRSDLAEVLDIERSAFEFPWLEEEFIRCLRQCNCIGMVAEHAERVVAFTVYEISSHRIRVLNFAVDPAHQRQGVGRQLIEKLKSKLRRERNRLVFDVREANLPAQLFFRAAGLVAVQIMPRFFDNGETAYRFEYRAVSCP